jgi:hypothetical protein
MSKFVLILYVPGIPALSMSDIDFDFGGLWTQGNQKATKPAYVLVCCISISPETLKILKISGGIITPVPHFELFSLQSRTLN